MINETISFSTIAGSVNVTEIQVQISDAHESKSNKSLFNYFDFAVS